MRRTPVLVAAFGLAMLAIAQASAPAPQAYPIVRVIDGDTVVVKINDQDTTVRLIGVDTPETVHPAKPVEAYGREASRFTRNLLVAC